MGRTENTVAGGATAISADRQVLGDRQQYEAGDVMAVDRSGHRRLVKTQEAYSTLVAGVVSTKPGILASQYDETVKDKQKMLQQEVPLAVVGIVPCKVTAENGPIEPGDLLVSASVPGYAMKGTERARMLGAVIGKAMEPLNADKGVIEVLVTLQ